MNVILESKQVFFNGLLNSCFFFVFFRDAGVQVDKEALSDAMINSNCDFHFFFVLFLPFAMIYTTRSTG